MIVNDLRNIFYLNNISILFCLAISETISAVVNGTPKRPRPPPPPAPVSISISSHIPPKKVPSIEDENSIQSTMTDILDRCTSSIENDVRSCLNDLCQRIEQSLSENYNQLPSPIFKRKIDKQIKNNHLIKTKPLTNNNEEKKEETIEQDISDIKPTIPTTNITSDYICDWENCRL